MSIDFGQVSIDSGPVLLSHEMEVRNSTDAEVEVVTVRRSCGCVEGEMSSLKIPPNGIAHCSIKFRVSSPGTQHQSVSAILSDGQIVSCSMIALGVVATRLTLIPSNSVLAEDSTTVIECMFVSSRYYEVLASPRVVSPEGVEMQFGGWQTIESGSLNRPSRHIGKCSLSFAAYEGEVPCDVVVEMKSGERATARVTERPREGEDTRR